jgi:hypothetical protein
MILTTAMITIVATHAASSSLSSSGTATLSGTVPTTFNISNTSNGSLSGAFGPFGTMVVGNGMLSAPSPVLFRLRSNAPYILTAQVGALEGISDGMAGTNSSTIKTADIGFGFTASIEQSGSSVVGGGATPTRMDTIAPGFDMRGGWPSPSGGNTPVFTKTLHDIYGQDVQILSGPRISAKGDNSSDDNFITITVGIAALPQYWNAGAFRGVVTFTIAPAGM